MKRVAPEAVRDSLIAFLDACGMPKLQPYQRHIMEQLMKPGPYKSSTHGNITLSERGRTLLAAERDAVQNAIRAGNFSTNDQSLSHARGEIALYISHLERFPAAEQTRFKNFMHTVEFDSLRFVRNPLFAGFDESITIKEQTMNDRTKGEAGPAAEKNRSELIGEATHELVAAQQALEYIENSPADAAQRMSLGIVGSGILAEGIQTLVLGQFDAMRKKVTVRAKARVAKAEKAISVLIG